MKSKLKAKFKIIDDILQNIREDHISEYSAQCAYYTILSFIPFLILLITLIQYTNIEQQTLFDIVSRIVPSSMNEIVVGIVKEVYSKSIGTISISIIFTLWSAGRGLYALTKGFKEVYKVGKLKRKSYIYMRILSVFQTMIFLIVLIVGLVLLVFGNSIISILRNNFEILKGYSFLSSIITEIFFIIITFVIFLLLYRFIVKQNTSFKQHILGAILGAIALNIVSFVFSKYLDIFKGFSITYGSLTTLILVMM